MKLYQIIKCDECSMEYKIIWDSNKFHTPETCAGCGADEPEIAESGFMA